MGGVGFEPTKAEPFGLQPNPFGHLGTHPQKTKVHFFKMERASGVEPPSRAWQARIITAIRRPRSLYFVFLIC